MTEVRRVPGATFIGRIADALSLVLVLLALPVGILLIGAPIAFLIKMALDLAGRLFG
jgi:hypothetical protein